ncbi:MAG: DUF1353 domain-containing protein [Planctomycetota bacterium]
MNGKLNFRFDGPESENYSGNIDVSIPNVPTIRLISIEFRENAGWLERLASATQKRKFALAEPWKVGLNRIEAPVELNGVVTIPVRYREELLKYDGASVPIPWLISFLSIGALRPLGVLLIPSIVHDFAFRFGELLVAPDYEQTPQVLKIERHEADLLFYNMIRSLNGDVLTASLAWVAVRLGWPVVPYNGKRGGGEWPTLVYVCTVIGLLFGGALLYGSVVTFGWRCTIGPIIGVYILLWLGTLFAPRVVGWLTSIVSD